ncbi:MAG TPA: sugar porter family MFS transporter [Candidatus Acidoferrales bacterium]|jgi:SP family arabinose:H+ symporter-like MFS transporter|nr:sugar porter family MFS transporter [Candidatus Acidoferrales bacterium]
MNSPRPVIFATAVAAIGGFLFGYDTAVINGANSLLQKHFALDPQRDSLLIGLATASAILGCIPGAMGAGFISDRFGRRRVLFFCAILYAVAGILSAIPQTFFQFIAARILSGIAIGVSSMICPVYIAEIAPPQWRGRLGSLFQLGIVTGIFVTLFINGWIQRPSDPAWNVALGWRWMLAAEAIPALFFLGLLFPIPESPRWLIQANRESEARTTLHRIGGDDYADAEILAVKQVLRQETGSFSEFFSRRYRLPLAIALVLMFGSQLSGINAIMYYSTEIFRNATGNASAAFTSSIWIGLVNFIATFIAIGLVDRAGRKPLLLVGNAIQVAALAAVGFIYGHNPHSSALLGFVILYIAAFAMAMGPLPWIVCSEIFPAKLRGRAMSVATFCIWTGCLLVAQTFPTLLQLIGPACTFWIFATCSAVTFVLVLWLLPETKGRTLEEIERSFAG